MTTRNEWIAETAREYRIHMDHDFAASIKRATRDACDLEVYNVAPWQPAPAQDDGEAVALMRLLEACDVPLRTLRAMNNTAALAFTNAISDARAYLARLDAAKGGAS